MTTSRLVRSCVAMVLGCWMLATAGCGGAQRSAAVAPAAELTCPVMGEKFIPDGTQEKSEYKGKTYVFCCPGCKAKFDADPSKYVRDEATPAVTSAATEVVCAVSGEKFVPAADSPRSEYQGKTWVFCCPGCKRKFDADPAKFAADAKPLGKDCGGDCEDKAKDAKPCGDCGDKAKDAKPCDDGGDKAKPAPAAPEGKPAKKAGK